MTKVKGLTESMPDTPQEDQDNSKDNVCEIFTPPQAKKIPTVMPDLGEVLATALGALGKESRKADTKVRLLRDERVIAKKIQENSEQQPLTQPETAITRSTREKLEALTITLQIFNKRN